MNFFPPPNFRQETDIPGSRVARVHFVVCAYLELYSFQLFESRRMETGFGREGKMLLTTLALKKKFFFAFTFFSLSPPPFYVDVVKISFFFSAV